MFDHGKRENWRRYGQVNPPKYSFKTVTTPVAVMWGMADTVTTAKVSVSTWHIVSRCVNFGDAVNTA